MLLVSTGNSYCMALQRANKDGLHWRCSLADKQNFSIN
jgi:hypothetical protein